MKEITITMINLFKIEEVDFMGYSINKSTLSYHHLIVPRRLGGPETIDNGAILNRLTSHPYLHIIENRDPEIFFLVTSEMVDENIKRKIDLENLRKINDLLNTFERGFCSSLTRKGKPLIKEEYTKRLIK